MLSIFHRHRKHKNVSNLIYSVFLNSLLDVNTLTIQVPFIIVSVLLSRNFWKAWKSNPGYISESSENKMKVSGMCSKFL